MSSNKFSFLPEHSAKKTNFEKKYPFPIVSGSNTQPHDGSEDPHFSIHIGYLQDDYVLVHDEHSILDLYRMGFFGKGTLSKKGLSHFQETGSSQKIVEKKPFSSEEIIEIEDDEESAISQNGIKDTEIVLSDSEMNSACGNESLQLTFEEAYFLSFGLGCLVVKNNENKPMDLAELWTRFCDLTTDKRFPIMYTAYHHLRSKGYIVRTGIKYGAEYVLYKDGPPFHHGAVSVIVKSSREKYLRDLHENKQSTWASLLALNRVNVSVGKTVLLLYVIKPDLLRDLSTPLCIKQFKIEEVVQNRWVPSENRSSTDSVPKEIS